MLVARVQKDKIRLWAKRMRIVFVFLRSIVIEIDSFVIRLLFIKAVDETGDIFLTHRRHHILIQRSQTFAGHSQQFLDTDSVGIGWRSNSTNKRLRNAIHKHAKRKLHHNAVCLQRLHQFSLTSEGIRCDDCEDRNAVRKLEQRLQRAVTEAALLHTMLPDHISQFRSIKIFTNVIATAVTSFRVIRVALVCLVDVFSGASTIKIPNRSNYLFFRNQSFINEFQYSNLPIR